MAPAEAARSMSVRREAMLQHEMPATVPPDRLIQAPVPEARLSSVHPAVINVGVAAPSQPG